MVGEAVEECGGHLGIAEGEVGGNDDGGLLVEAAYEMEEQLAAGWPKGR